MVKEFEQSYYTSCQKGLTSGPGFQTKAISPGIPADTRRLIERFISTYQLPAGRDRNVEEGQPASLKSFSLGRGKWCVSLTHYRRFDRKGALGNFFAHSLVCSREDFRDFGANPFLLYHSGQFKEEDTGTDTILPVATIEITPRPLRSAVEPLTERIADQSRLLNLLDAILRSPVLKRPVVIVMNPDDVLLVVEAVIALLPLSIRADISFSTYESAKPPARIEDPAFPDATQVMLCSGTTELRKARQSYSEIELDYSFLIFDFEESHFSKALPSSQFSEWVSGKVFKRDYQAIEACVDFISLFDVTAENVDEALSLYCLPDSVERGDHNRVATALKFAETASDHPKRAAATVGRLVAVPERSAHEMTITRRALTLSANHGLEQAGDVYRRFLGLLISAINSADRRNVPALLEAANQLPSLQRIRLVEDLIKSKVPDEFLLSVLASAMRTNPFALDVERAEALFQCLIRLFDSSLNAGDGTFIAKLMDVRRSLPEQQQFRIACEISSLKGVDSQVSLIEAALGHLRKISIPEDAVRSLGKRMIDLFVAAAKTGRDADTLLVLSRVPPLLPLLLRMEFIDCLDENLDLLWQNLRAALKQKDAEGLAQLWLKLLMEDEFFAVLTVNEPLGRELNSRGNRTELLAQLASRKIDCPKIVAEGTDAQHMKLVVQDAHGTEYRVEHVGTQLHVYRQDAKRSRAQIAKLLGIGVAGTPPACEFNAAWEAVFSALDRNRLRQVPPEMFQRLCEVVSRKLTDDGVRLRVYRTRLVPMLDGLPDKVFGVRVLVGSLVSGRQQRAGDRAYSDLQELLRGLGVTLDDIKRIYASKPSPVLFDEYWRLLGAGRDGLRLETELIDLYLDRSYDLFQQLVRRVVQEAPGHRTELVCLLLDKLPALRGDAACFSGVVSACMQFPDNSKFVSGVAALLAETGSEQGLAALAKQCAAKMRGYIASGERASKAEDDVIDRWLKMGGSSEPGVVDALLVFRELQGLRYETADLRVFVENYLREFQGRKARLDDQDYTLAARRVLSVLASRGIEVNHDNWKCVEKIAARAPDAGPNEGLIAEFFGWYATRRNYRDLLIHVTVRWIGQWPRYQACREALRQAYRLLDSRSKEAYEQSTEKGLKSLPAEAAKGLEWWRGMIDPPRPKGLFRW